VNPGRLYKVALIGVAALLFWGVSAIQGSLNVDREKFELTTFEPLENAPPVLAFTTVALGAFRGLIANALWIRASNLQEEDKYFEMVQLADWITKLEPRFADVWRVQAWNMAYNISVKFKNFEDRWRWVQRGFQLLRDDGLRYNPRSADLYRELSTIYAHKIGANLDDAHMVYKLHLAQQMEEVVDGHPNFEGLMHPKTTEEKERAEKLRKDFKMDPEIMKKVDEDYGPLDWRLPETLGIYWAEVGRLKSNATPVQLEALRRQIFQSMQLACRRGGALPPSIHKVTWESLRFLEPNLDLVPKVNDSYLEMIKEEPDQETFRTGHKNFLKMAVYLLYVSGRTNQANHWYKYLGQTYTNAFLGPEANLTMEQWSMMQITSLAKETDMDQVTDILMGLMRQGFLALVVDEDEKGLSYQGLAKQVWNYYESRVKGIPEKRIGLPPLSEIRVRVLNDLLDPNNHALSTQELAILRTKLKLPATGLLPSPTIRTPSTNAPPVSQG
jgi:hypothetical protein